MNPFKFRPLPPSEEDPEPTDWEDNAISNAMAYASTKLTPSWCATPEHWTARLTGYLWTSCYCCAAMRFLLVGIAVGFLAGLAL